MSLFLAFGIKKEPPKVNLEAKVPENLFRVFTLYAARAVRAS